MCPGPGNAVRAIYSQIDVWHEKIKVHVSYLQRDSILVDRELLLGHVYDAGAESL